MSFYLSGSQIPENAFTPSSEEQVLKVAIVGGGICGLSSAIALRRSGHEVQIFERSSFTYEAGAAIVVGSNATRVLNYWGVDLEKLRPVPQKKIRMLSNETAETLKSLDMPDWNMLYGAYTWLVHRADLHEGLRTLATNTYGATIHCDSEVRDIDPDSGIITTPAGNSVFDLVVVADGIHSRLLKKITGTELEPISSGRSCYRFLIPTEKLLNNDTTRHLFENDLQTVTLTDDTEKRIVCYPCRNSELMNFGMIFHHKSDQETSEGWTNSVSAERLLDDTKDLAPEFTEIFKLAEDVKVWKMMTRETFKPWTRGRAVAAGDAAHAFLPFIGQGGAQAIEDAAALGALLSHIPQGRDRQKTVAERLQLYEKIRWARGSSLQLLSSTPIDEASEQTDEVMKKVKDILGVETPHDTVECIDYACKYNVLEDCMAAMPDIFPPIVKKTEDTWDF